MLCFYKLKARHSTNKKDQDSLYCDTPFIAVVWNWSHNFSDVCLQLSLWWILGLLDILPLPLLLLPKAGFHDLMMWKDLRAEHSPLMQLVWFGPLPHVLVSLPVLMVGFLAGWGPGGPAWLPWLLWSQAPVKFLPCPPFDHNLHSPHTAAGRTFHPFPWCFWTQLPSAFPRGHLEIFRSLTYSTFFLSWPWMDWWMNQRHSFCSSYVFCTYSSRDCSSGICLSTSKIVQGT